MKIVSKGASQLFAGIDRGELDVLSEYFQSKKIRVQRIQEDVLHKIALDESDDDDVDDDDSRRDERRKKKVFSTKIKSKGAHTRQPIARQPRFR